MRRTPRSQTASHAQHPAIAGILDMFPKSGPEWDTRWLMAQILGSVNKRRDGHWRVSVSQAGERFRIGSMRVAGTNVWVSLETRNTAEQVLHAIRSRFASGMNLAASVSPFIRRSGDSTLVEHIVERFLERETSRCRAGDISPNTLKDVRRFTRKDGEFSRWVGWDVNSITYRELEAWRLQLSDRGLSAKTARNVR